MMKKQKLRERSFDSNSRGSSPNRDSHSSLDNNNASRRKFSIRRSTIKDIKGLPPIPN